jgi:hypothetical protein
VLELVLLEVLVTYLLHRLLPMNVQFINNLTSSVEAPQGHTHNEGSNHSHSHGEDHGHTHEHLDHPGATQFTILGDQLRLFPTGKYSERDLPDYHSRNFEERGFTVGIGGCVPKGSHLVPKIEAAMLIKARRVWKDCPHTCSVSTAQERI